jgi:cytochrome c-type biogenesis protein CcmH/NrfF
MRRGKRLHKRLLSVFTIAMVALLTLGAANPERFERLGHRMVCTCGCNQILLECNHVGCPSSDKMRNELTAVIDSGNSDSAVLASFVDKYGPPVLAAPLATGFGRVAWIMPFAVFALALLGCVYLVKIWKARSLATPAITPLPAGSPEAESLRLRARQETEL